MNVGQGREPFNDPVELLDELDSLIAEQESLRLRAVALAARYRELESYAGRFDKPGPTEWSPTETFGSVNIEFTVRNLVGAVRDMAATAKYSLLPARELAEKVREYPQRELAESPRVGRGRSL